MKRFISALLSLVMAISLLAYLPIQVHAVDITDHVFTYPVTKSHKRLSRGYSTANEHFAIDISPSPNSSSKTKDVEVMATCDGVVIKVYTGCNNWSGGSSSGVNCKNAGICNPSDGFGSGFCNIGFGNGLIIYHPSTKTYSAYGHMMKDSITVKAGDNVVAGQLIGYMGSCGWSTGKHLHFEIVHSTKSSPSLSDYMYNRFTTKNCVNTNPYGDISVGSSSSRDPDNIYYNFLDAPVDGEIGPSIVTIESYSNKVAGTTGDTWLYPAFKVTVPNYRNSGISTVGYSVYTVDGKEMFRFQETYKSGVNKDGTSYKNTFFGARTDGEANMDLASDVTDVSRVYYIENLKFTPGHSYKVKGFIIFDGKRYESSEFGYATTGTKQCTWDSGKVTQAATCKAAGVKTYTCRTCGATRTESISPKEHTPGAITCTSPQKCTDCGAQIAPAPGHTWDNGSIIQEPTCIEEGLKVYTCSSCGEIKMEIIHIRPHVPGEAATCTTPQKCTVCGAQIVPALGHNYSGSYYYSAHPHEEYQKCTRCNAEKKTDNTKKVTDCSICYPTVTFTVTYNANGGKDAPAPQTKESGKTLTLSSVKPTREGYTFLGWATSSGASSAQYNAGGSFTTDANTTLYAVWKINVPSVAKFTNASASKGDRVVLEFVVEQRIEASALLLGDIEYDKNVLTLDYSKVEICPTIFFQNSDPETGIMIGFSSSSPVVGTVFKIPFIISSSATDGEYTVSGKLQYQVSGVEGLIDAETKSGSINITSVKRGDVNGDDMVNADDAIHLMWYTFRPERYPVTKQSHDYNGDGMVNADDAIHLMWHTFRPDRYPLN